MLEFQHMLMSMTNMSLPLATRQDAFEKTAEMVGRLATLTYPQLVFHRPLGVSVVPNDGSTVVHTTPSFANGPPKNDAAQQGDAAPEPKSADTSSWDSPSRKSLSSASERHGKEKEDPQRFPTQSSDKPVASAQDQPPVIEQPLVIEKPKRRRSARIASGDALCKETPKGETSRVRHLLGESKISRRKSSETLGNGRPTSIGRKSTKADLDESLSSYMHPNRHVRNLIHGPERLPMPPTTSPPKGTTENLNRPAIAANTAESVKIAKSAKTAPKVSRGAKTSTPLEKLANSIKTNDGFLQEEGSITPEYSSRNGILESELKALPDPSRELFRIEFRHHKSEVRVLLLYRDIHHGGANHLGWIDVREYPWRLLRCTWNSKGFEWALRSMFEDVLRDYWQRYQWVKNEGELIGVKDCLGRHVA